MPQGDTTNGRWMAYHYRQYGIEGLTAGTPEEYLTMVQRLLDDRDWKEQKSREIKDKAHLLLDIKASVDELQDFLEAAYERSRQGLPPAHWASGRFVE
jgi:hypothetical protein